MTNLVINNVIEINGPFCSKDFYEKNRKIKEKYYNTKINPATHTLGTGWTKKQKLSEKRKDIKHEQANNNQFYNRTSKIKEKMFCAQDEIDLEQDLENEHRISEEIEKRAAQEALAAVWFQRLLTKSKEDIRFVPQSESSIMYFMEKHDVDPAQLQYAEESLQKLIAASKRYEWIDDEWQSGCDSDDDDWYTGCWH